MAASTNQIWIHQDAVPWLVEYLREEARSGGVAYDDEEDETQNDEVDGLHVSWDFQNNDAWVGKWVDGPFKGHIVTVPLSKFNETKFQTSAAKAGIGASFSDASREDVKAAARQFLLIHCEEQLELSAHSSCGNAFK